MNPAPPFAVAVCGIEELAGHGTLGATHALHRLQLQVRPHLAEFMTDAGREREVLAAWGSAPL